MTQTQPTLDYDPNTETEWFSLVSTFDECLYDYRDSAQFILNVDMDDLLVPRRFKSLPEELNYLSIKHPNAASFEFLWANSQFYVSSQDYKIKDIMTNNYMHELVSYGKSVIRPRRLSRTFIHHPIGTMEILDGYEHIVLTENDSLTVHLRASINDSVRINCCSIKCVFLNNKKIWNFQTLLPRSNLYFSGYNRYSMIDDRIHAFLDRNIDAKQVKTNQCKSLYYSNLKRRQSKNIFKQNPNGKTLNFQAFNRLPQNSQYSPIFFECYKRIGAAINNNTKLTQCTTPLNCRYDRNTLDISRSSCVTLVNEYKYTKLETNVFVSSVDFGGFVHNSDCLAIMQNKDIR